VRFERVYLFELVEAAIRLTWWSCCQCSEGIAGILVGQPQPSSFFQGRLIILPEALFDIPFNESLLSIQIEFDCELVDDEQVSTRFAVLAASSRAIPRESGVNNKPLSPA
jgi:hypothetical protein